MTRAISSGAAMRPSGCEAPMSPRAAWRSGAPASAALTKSVSTAPGGDRVDAHAVGGVLDRELPRDLGDRALGRAVRALRGKPDDPRDRRDVDDRATAALDEVRQRLPAVDEDAAHVGRHQPVPLVVRRLDDRLQQEAARVVDDDVEPAEARQGEVDRPARGVGLGGVRAQGGDPIVARARSTAGSMSSATTFAPAARSWATTAPPMPPAAPVTMATAPSRPASSMAARRYRMMVIQSGRTREASRRPPRANVVVIARALCVSQHARAVLRRYDAELGAGAPSPIGQLTPVPPRPQ